MGHRLYVLVEMTLVWAAFVAAGIHYHDNRVNLSTAHVLVGIFAINGIAIYSGARLFGLFGRRSADDGD